MLKKIIHIISYCLLITLGTQAYALNYPSKPTQDVFYVDEAKLINLKDGLKLNEIARKLWQEQHVPLLVVSIPSLDKEGASDTTIDGYTRSLFDYWGIGYKDRNYGMLLLVSRDDHKARIELGDAWGHQYESQTHTIMSNIIIPLFKSGQFSAGILAGTKALDNMARGIHLPAAAVSNTTAPPAVPAWANILGVLAMLGLAGLVFSLFRSGRTGWGWASIAFIGLAIWYILRNNNNGGGGSGGSTMGGGSSGGGGSTGSW